MRESNVFRDVDYEGSNISTLINLLAYAGQIVNANTSFGINEMLLSDAVNRVNVLKSARNLGYEALRVRSAVYQLELTPSLPWASWTTASTVFRIPKYTKFKSADKTFYYLGDDIEQTIYQTDLQNLNANAIITLEVKEGILKTSEEVEDLNYDIDTYVGETGELLVQSNILLYHNDIEEDGVEVFVTSPEDVNVYFQATIPTSAPKNSIWVKTDQSDGKVSDIIDSTEIYIGKAYSNTYVKVGEWEFISTWKNSVNSVIGAYKNNPSLDIDAIDPLKDRPFRKREYFVVDDDIEINKDTFLPLRDFESGYLRLFFKYGGTGKELFAGTSIKANVLISSGSAGNADVGVIEIDDLSVSANLQLNPGSTPKLTRVGSEEESTESVKENAPIFYNTANRAVTAKDYEAICERRTEIQRSKVWGGENLIVKQKGEVFLSFYSSLTSNISDDFVYNPDTTTYRLTYNDIYNNITGVALEPNASAYYDEKCFLGQSNINEIKQYLERYKVITLSLNHVNPVFIDVGYDINVVRYVGDLQTTHSQIFNVINNYFRSDMMDFGSEYFNSTVIRMIDEQLGNGSGVEVDVKFGVVLSTGNYQLADASLPNDRHFEFYLEFPFEDIFDKTVEKQMLLDSLPNISTSQFIKGANVYDSLIVDYSKVKHSVDSEIYLTEIPSGVHELNIFPIMFGASQCGEYFVRNGELDNDNYIKVELWIKDTAGASTVDSKYALSSLETDYFDQPQTLRLSQKSDNIRLARNTIPRLNSIEFN